MSGFWAPGTTVLWRYTRPGHPSRSRDVGESLRPMRVVRDDAEGLVAWLPGGTPVLRPVLADGSDLRSVPLAERFDLARHGLVNRLDTWWGHGVLKIAPTARAWSVWLFWDDEGGFAGWYVNLEAAHRRATSAHGAGEVVSEDHVLDVVVRPDRTTARKDEDELAAAVAGGRFSAAQAGAIEADAAEVEDLVARWGSPFCDGWERFVPDPTWTAPAMPPEHARGATYR